jgi:protein-tyrosine phosphatase
MESADDTASPDPLTGIPLVDLHAHILPGIDDGARDDAQALAMLRVAEADGIVSVIATPHAHHVRHHDVPAAVERLNRLAKTEEIAVDVLPGSEVRIGTRAVELHREGKLLTLNGTPYVLFELFFHEEWPLQLVTQACARLQDAGLRPVLSHAERYAFVQRDPLVVAPLVEQGVLVQLNALSLDGYEGVLAQRAAERLIRDGLAHVLASDAHNHERRAPRLRAALRRVAELTSMAQALEMAATAAAIATGADVLPCEPPPAAEENAGQDH